MVVQLTIRMSCSRYPPAPGAPTQTSPDAPDPLAERVDRLEQDLAALASQVAQLRAALGD